MSRLWNVLAHPVLAGLVVGVAAAALFLAARGRAQGRVGLTVAGPVPAPSVLAGLALYDELGCAGCHGIQGEGGKAGRDLWRVGARRSRLWLRAFLPNPAGLLPGAAMPPFRLPPADLELLVAYLGSLDLTDRAALLVSPEMAYGARDLVRAGCLACHRVGPEGGAAGPDLTRVGARAGTEALARELGGASRHAGFADGRRRAGLSEATRGRIATYLSALR